MNRLNKGKNLKAGTLAIRISVAWVKRFLAIFLSAAYLIDESTPFQKANATTASIVRNARQEGT
jgi:hypothetical protein